MGLLVDTHGLAFWCGHMVHAFFSCHIYTSICHTHILIEKQKHTSTYIHTFSQCCVCIHKPITMLCVHSHTEYMLQFMEALKKQTQQLAQQGRSTTNATTSPVVCVDIHCIYIYIYCIYVMLYMFACACILEYLCRCVCVCVKMCV